MEIADASVISNFALINRLDILASTIKLCTTEEVAEELKVCAEKGIFRFDEILIPEAVSKECVLEGGMRDDIKNIL